MSKIYALFKVGNGMSVHPTPTGHDNIYDAVVEAYESNSDETKEYLYKKAKKMIELQELYRELCLEYYKENKKGRYIGR